MQANDAEAAKAVVCDLFKDKYVTFVDDYGPPSRIEMQREKSPTPCDPVGATLYRALSVRAAGEFNDDVLRRANLIKNIDAPRVMFGEIGRFLFGSSSSSFLDCLDRPLPRHLVENSQWNLASLKSRDNLDNCGHGILGLLRRSKTVWQRLVRMTKLHSSAMLRDVCRARLPRWSTLPVPK